MGKAKLARLPSWARNLRTLMEKKDYNPRSLSLKAGLNATAVRDMLEGRSRFPRYDTIKALADALDTTPALLMGEKELLGEIIAGGFTDDLELLTEVIAELQKTADEYKRKLPPRDFAAMTATIYRSIQSNEERGKKPGSIRAQIHDLLDYEILRQKRNGR